MKFTIDYEFAMRLQHKIASKKNPSHALTDVTIRVGTDGRTDLFATNGKIMGAFFKKIPEGQEEMNLDVFEEEKIFTVDLRPLKKIKSIITGSYIPCKLVGNMLHIRLNTFDEELVLRTYENEIFDQFIETLSFDEYTNKFDGQTMIDTDLLSKVAFGDTVMLRRGIEDENRFLVTNDLENYRGVIMGVTFDDEELPEEENPVEGLPFNQDLEDLQTIRKRRESFLENNPEEFAKLQVSKNKVIKNILKNDIVPEGMKVSVEHNGNETIIGDKTNG